MASASRSVDVWFRLTAGIPATEVERELSVIDSTEAERWKRFAFDDDRRDYAMAHALLRRLLSRRHAVSAETWRFEATPSGKPHVAANFADLPLAFSLSHTRGLVACAVSEDAEVGIDVEPINRLLDVDDLAARLFSPVETRALAAIPPAERPVRFTELWTLKEAYVKALGCGLSHPLSEFAFEFGVGTALQFEAPAIDNAAWCFALFAVGPIGQYRLALAVRAENRDVERRLDVANCGGCSDARLIRLATTRRPTGESRFE